jgi:hypothetical protein
MTNRAYLKAKRARRAAREQDLVALTQEITSTLLWMRRRGWIRSFRNQRGEELWEMTPLGNFRLSSPPIKQKQH